MFALETQMDNLRACALFSSRHDTHGSKLGNTITKLHYLSQTKLFFSGFVRDT